MDQQAIRIGRAGWSVAPEQAERFAPGASWLARYATRLPAVEINSSFYRSHRPATYARWAATTPDAFRFAVRLPRTITHERRLRDCTAPLRSFLDAAGALGAKLGPLLVQLPPSLAFDPAIAHSFWQLLRERCPGEVVCEPRHPGWFTPTADRLLQTWQVARVAANPPRNTDSRRLGAGLRRLTVCRRRISGPERWISDFDISVARRAPRKRAV